jgi:hypothetical protein
VDTKRGGILLAGCIFVTAGWPAMAQAVHLPMEPQRESGQSVTGAYEGWFPNADGSFSMLVGYFNRNLQEELEIPAGPNNTIQPGDPDRGQPTHFFTGRQWGVFRITVPKDFGASTKLTWTLTAHGQTTTIPLSLNPLWEISPFAEAGVGNTPPTIRFGPGGPSVHGPLATNGATLTTSIANPVTLAVAVADDAKVAPGATPPRTPPVTLTWSKFRGPGAVTFANSKPRVEKTEGGPSDPAYTGKASTTATFSEPGDYVLLVVANDWSGEGGRGFQCCWTTAEVRVSVKAATGR